MSLQFASYFTVAMPDICKDNLVVFSTSQHRLLLLVLGCFILSLSPVLAQNLIMDSEDFLAPSWFVQGAAPRIQRAGGLRDGLPIAQRLTFIGEFGGYKQSLAADMKPDTAYTASVFVRDEGGSQFRIALWDGTQYLQSTFDVASEKIYDDNGKSVARGCKRVAEEWLRCWVTWRTGAEVKAPHIELRSDTAGSLLFTQMMLNEGQLAKYTSNGSSSWLTLFEDFFESDKLDGSKWGTSYWFWDASHGGSTNQGNAEEQWYLPRNVDVKAGRARLRANNTPHVTPDGTTYAYTSGMLSSEGRFDFQYGYVEARMRVPLGRGFLSGFWLLPTRDAVPSWPPEIDVIEVLGSKPRTAHFNLHYRESENTSSSPHAYVGTDLSENFHTYGCLWEEGRLVFYLDGVEQHRIEGEAVPNQAMYLLFTLAVGGTWPGSPDASTPFPSDLDVDYVRVKQRN